MSREERREQIIKELEETGLMMKPFYYKKEVESELREFQKQMVMKVFEETHGKELRIQDVQAHINELAIDKGIDQSNEIVKFNEKTEKFKKLIAKEISGNKGERHMNNTIKMVKERHKFLSNVELEDDDFVTEIDGVVITKRAIFVLEAKYSQKDMVITEEGNYVEENNPHVIYCNIGEKVNTKEYLLRKALQDAGFDKKIKIEKMVVFSNNCKQLRNDFQYISSCYCSQLPYVIDKYEGADIYTLEDIETIMDILKNVQNHKAYQIDFDFDEYRFLFADALAYIEDTVEETGMEEQNGDYSKDNGTVWKRFIKIGVVATGFTILATTKIIKKSL